MSSMGRRSATKIIGSFLAAPFLAGGPSGLGRTINIHKLPEREPAVGTVELSASEQLKMLIWNRRTDHGFLQNCRFSFLCQEHDQPFGRKRMMDTKTYIPTEIEVQEYDPNENMGTIEFKVFGFRARRPTWVHALHSFDPMNRHVTTNQLGDQRVNMDPRDKLNITWQIQVFKRPGHLPYEIAPNGDIVKSQPVGLRLARAFYPE